MCPAWRHCMPAGFVPDRCLGIIDCRSRQGMLSCLIVADLHASLSLPGHKLLAGLSCCLLRSAGPRGQLHVTDTVAGWELRGPSVFRMKHCLALSGLRACSSFAGFSWLDPSCLHNVVHWLLVEPTCIAMGCGQEQLDWLPCTAMHVVCNQATSSL
jgi:hypothetical protein